MPGKNYDSVEAYFYHEDYVSTDLDKCYIIFASERTIQLALSCMRYLEYYNTRWLSNGQRIPKGDTKRDDISLWVSTAMEDFIMACSAEEINTNLARIATAVEGIDSKMQARLTWEEFISDVEAALGVGSLIPAVLTAFFGLMPNIRAKLDFTTIAISAWEWWSRWLPITTAITSIAAAQGVQAAAAVSARVIGIIDTVLSVFPIIQTAFLGWKDIIVGDKNLWDDLIRPMMALFAGDDPQVPEPDTDSTLRPMVNVLNRTIVQNTIDACCPAMPDLPLQPVPPTIVSGDQGNVSPTSPPVDYLDIEWGAAQDTSNKCKAANYIVDSVIEFLTILPTRLTLDAVNLSIIVNVIAGSIALMVSVPLAIPVALLFGFAATLLAAALNLEVFEELNDLQAVITSNRSDLVCILNEAVDVSTASSQVRDLLINQGINPTIVSIAMFLFNNTMLSTLFYATTVIPTVNYIDNCPCGEGCDDMLDSHLVFVGTLIDESETQTTATFQANSVSNAGAQQIGIGTDTGYFPQCCFKIISWSWSGSPAEPFINGGFFCGGIAMAPPYDVDTMISVEEPLNTFYLQRPIDEPFSVTITIQRV